MNVVTSPSSRSTLLRLRCEMQRQQLAEELTQIEQRAQSMDGMLKSARQFLNRPVVMIGALALLLSVTRRTRPLALLSRGLVAFATARKLYRMVRS